MMSMSMIDLKKKKKRLLPSEGGVKGNTNK